MDKTVARKLSSLLKLQGVDSQLDDIARLKGSLPEEVNDLEDEKIGLEARFTRLNESLKSLEQEIVNQREKKQQAEKLLQKYSEQQKNVRNNREYDAITKEAALQQLEIQLADKRIKGHYESIEQKKEGIEQTKSLTEEKQAAIEEKKQELESINKESVEQEKMLLEERDKVSQKLEPRLLNAYEKMRGNVRNGLVVVPVRREACGGCFNIVPPQRQVEVKEKKRIIICENCGRILASVETPPPPKVEKATRAKTTRKTTKKTTKKATTKTTTKATS